MTKKYKTRSGLAARILCIDRKDYYSVVALIEITPGVEDIIIQQLNGKLSIIHSDDDLIEVKPFEDFKIDDLCVVWQTGYEKQFRYFSHAYGYSDSAYCFVTGTSYTTHSTTRWDNCRKATQQEIETKEIHD